MRDVSRKSTSLRSATATAVVRACPETIERIRVRDLPKGDALEVARVAAIQAAKDTSRIIPHCHPVAITHVAVEYEWGADSVIVRASVKAIDRTGVEMEALTAASVAALTIYDMVKMLDDRVEIEAVKLIEKKGGKSDFQDGLDRPVRSGVLVASDSVSAGKAEDSSGPLIEARLREEGFEVIERRVIPDDRAQIVEVLKHFADTLHVDLVLTTGGTGLGPRDRTPEAMSEVIEREIPGIAEALRTHGGQRTPFAMLSRGRAGVRGQTVVINLPGSERGVAESLDALFPGLRHAFRMLWGESHREKRARG